MVKCCVEGCPSHSKLSTEDITFHRFPDVRCFPKLFLKWSQKVSGCPEDEAPVMVPQPSDRVCSLHFTEDDFAIRTDRNRTRRKALRVEALPTQRLPAERKSSWGPALSELTISHVSGSFTADNDMTSPDANGNTDTNGIQRLPIPDEGIPNENEFGNKNHLPPKMARKKKKNEPKEHRVAIKSTLERDELEALIQAKQLEITFPDHPDSSQPQPESSVNGSVEESPDIPPCFRSKKDLRSLFAFVITPLENEGFDLMMINDNKYIKCDAPDSDSLTWRCILKNCAVHVTTSSVHCSILVGTQGVHYHLPTKDVAVNVAAWVKTMEPKWDMEPEPGRAAEVDPDIELEEAVCGGEPQPEPEPSMKIPPWARNGPWPRTVVESRFGVKDLLAPSIARFQHSNILSVQQSTMTPVENIQAAFASLTKYSGGQLIAAVDPFSAIRFPGTGDFPNVSAFSSACFPSPQSTENSTGPQSASSTTLRDEQDYVHQSPASERSKAVVNEASENSGSNSEPMGSRMGEPLYEQLVHEVDAHALMQKDPLAVDESNDGDPKSDDQQPTEGPGSGPLSSDFVSFFESLGPHLEQLSADLRQHFKAKVVLILSDLCKEVSPNTET